LILDKSGGFLCFLFSLVLPVSGIARYLSVKDAKLKYIIKEKQDIAPYFVKLTKYTHLNNGIKCDTIPIQCVRG